MPPRKKKSTTKPKKAVETLTHSEAKRKNIPSAEHQSVMREEDKSPIQVAYERRNRDLDPQLVWRGKDMQDWSDLVVQAGPLYVQEKVHPKVLIDDLQKLTASQEAPTSDDLQFDLFADFNGIPDGAERTEFYQHDANWTNRMILGDSLQVMASLAEREGLRGQVQCIYFDPPYGIKFNSNFQWSTTSRDVKDGKPDHITREPEQVKAFRDTWRDGIHSYLTYLRDRLMVARDLLTESGSVFVQIGDENVHRVRAIMDEVFGEGNFIALIHFNKTGLQASNFLSSSYDHIVWFGKNRDDTKYRQLSRKKVPGESGATGYTYIEENVGELRSLSKEERDNPALIGNADRVLDGTPLISAGSSKDSTPIHFRKKEYKLPPNSHWKTTVEGIQRLKLADRIVPLGNRIEYKMFLGDYGQTPIDNFWMSGGERGFTGTKVYVVQTATDVIERCILMTSDPGDLVLDPTCGSGTTAYVAEQWGRRWITIDTSRVALALARARIMGARYPYWLLADSPEGQEKEAALSQTAPSTAPTYGNIRQGFVYERVPHITLKSIANNAEIDVIWDDFQKKLEPLSAELNAALDKAWEEWEIPREADAKWPEAAMKAHAAWWEARIARQKKIDDSIAAKADSEYLYDKPYTDNRKVRVAGPFTVESESPHRMLVVDEEDNLVNAVAEDEAPYGGVLDFTGMILENLRAAGVQQAHKEDRITFTSLAPWPGNLVCAEGRFEVDSGQWLVDSGKQAASQESPSTREVRAGVLIGPEFGTVQRNDLVVAARECGDAGFDVLIACAFNFDAHSSEFDKLGKIPVLKARMNADLHMAKDLKATGKGNLFVIFGEPDLEVISGEWLVASNGRLVANYGDVKELSGLGSLEEINRLGGEDLPRFKRLSSGREVRADQPDPAGGGVGAVEHRGGRGTDGDGGISPVSERGKRVAGGGGDATDPGGAAGLSAAGGTAGSGGGRGGNQSHARRASTVAAIETLRAGDFPLSLTTSHFAQVTVHGVDVFKPQTGEVVSDGPDGIACWFIDTDYNEESFFVRHAYFLGQNDPYKSLKRTLKAEINEEAWASLNSATSRPFEKPKGGRIAVKVINHLGDEVMKVFRV